MTPYGLRIFERLNNREKQIISLLPEALSNQAIADRLGLKHQVVKNYMRMIFLKTRAESRTELVLLLIRNGVLQCPCKEKVHVGSIAELEDQP